ncbi:MAG TPA: Gfo/Idh/MocA family oxidoreductase [Bryobacteraceae bacterium]|nr:Gfo/Idh/MocA family oxidoreductase [Bryobacteraceae bacterium]
MAGSSSAIQAAVRPSDRIRVGVIGCGGMGRMDLADFRRQPDVDIAAVCDVFQPNTERAREAAGGKAEAYSDFRRVLDRRDIDAVVIATPDHWHALMTVLACDAGKDVYVEKPVSHNVREGRLMVDAARRNRRIVQIGLQQRSGSHFQRAVRAVQEGRIGRVHFAQCWNHTGAADPKGMGFPKDTAPPADLDWDMWLGPAPKTPYNPARRNFRVWWDYAGGELTNWCVHLIDIVHWATGLDRPLTVASSGGKYHIRDCRECPDTQEVIWEYPELLVRYSTMVHNSFGPNGDPGNKPFGSYGIMLQGTDGTLIIDRAGYQITPQMKGHAEPVSQAWREAFDDLTGIGMYYTSTATAERGTTSVQHMPHVRNFVDCMKSRQTPAADIETGHRSTAACLIGNIALQTGQKLQWNAQRERFTNNDAANERLWRRYRRPWQLPGLET